MDMGKIIGLAVVGVTIIVLLRQYRPEYGMVASVMTGLLLLFMVIEQLTPVLQEMQILLGRTTLEQEHAGILFKSLGVCFVTQIACEACQDAGESSIASKVEMAGKVAVVTLSLPLFQELLKIVLRLISG